MDLVTISLDLVLMLLLMAALAYGVRLERRLKALRDGHTIFAQAVRELDQSVLRAESGLAQLRQAGEEARDGLHDRILKAREAKAELERLIARAERLRHDAPPASQPRPQLQSRPVEASARAPVAQDRGEAAAERLAQTILSLGEGDLAAPEPPRLALRRGRLQPDLRPVEPAPERRAPRRARAPEDDLFEAPQPELRIIGGRR